MPTAPFADAVDAAIRAVGTCACIGLDPVVQKLPAAIGPGLPAARIESFCKAVIDAIAGRVAIVKPQSACFERYGSAGFAAMERTIAHARAAGLIVILDAKRADIGTTAEHYAAAAAGVGAQAITLSGYMGPSTVEPFLEAGLGVFILVRTSNPDSDEIQAQRLGDGRTVAAMMADMASRLGAARIGASGYSQVGAVVGATKASEARAVRERLPRSWFLVPGFGAQGGTIEDVRALADARGGGVIVNASRSILYAFEPGDPAWIAAVVRAAAGLREAMGEFVPRPLRPAR